MYGTDRVTAEGHVQLARAALAAASPGALFGGGSDANFAELNRRRPAPGTLDRLVYGLSPQVHAFDDATMIENLASPKRVAETLRSFADGALLAITPVTLRPRRDPAPAAWRAKGEVPFTDDPRQSGAFAAAWTLGLLAAAAEAGFASLTLFELVGARGVMDASGPFPVLHVLADVALPGAQVAQARPRRPERVQALALRSERRCRLLLANVTSETHPVRVEGLAGAARLTRLGEPGPGEASELVVELAPREIVRLDVELS